MHLQADGWKTMDDRQCKCKIKIYSVLDRMLYTSADPENNVCWGRGAKNKNSEEQFKIGTTNQNIRMESNLLRLFQSCLLSSPPLPISFVT